MHDHDIPLTESLDPQGGQPSLIPQCEVHDRHPIGGGQRLGKQDIGFRRFAVGLQEIAAVIHQWVDLDRRDELQHLDLVAAFLGQGSDVLVGDHHRLATIGLVGLGDVAVLDRLTALVAHPLIFDSTVVLGVYLMELQVVILGGAVHLHRNVH